MVTAKDFRIPYSWQERHVTISDRIWFVPVRPVRQDFVFSGWHQLFSKEQSVCIEYCSGNGAWIIERAKQNPEKNWLAVEKRFDRARKIWVKATNAKLSNLAVALAEGLDVTKQFIPTESVQEVYVNFPDPWPKRRHEKHRIISESFVMQLDRIVMPSGKVTLVTDDKEYSDIMIDEMQKLDRFQSLFAPPYYQEAPKEYGSSFFDELFRDHNRLIRMHIYERR